MDIAKEYREKALEAIREGAEDALEWAKAALEVAKYPFARPEEIRAVLGLQKGQMWVLGRPSHERRMRYGQDARFLSQKEFEEAERSAIKRRVGR